MEKFCPSCGKEREEGVKFCPGCGHNYDSATPSNVGGTGGVTGQPSNEYVPNYMAFSIIVTLLFCLPAGIVAIVYASQVNTKLNAGDVEGAKYSSKNAKTWCWVSLGVGILAIIIYIAVLSSSRYGGW